MKVIGINAKEKQKKELYKILKAVPIPGKRFNLTTSQKYWWFWIGRELVQTNKFSKLDQIHLQKAAFWMDMKMKTIDKINEANEKSEDGLGGVVQKFRSGATNITGYVTVIEKADKVLDEISAHYGLSIRDRNKLKEAPKEDPNQTNIFEEFLNKHHG